MNLELLREIIFFTLLTFLGSYFIFLYHRYKFLSITEEDYKEKAILDIFSFLFICFGIVILFSNTINFIKYLIILNLK